MKKVLIVFTVFCMALTGSASADLFDGLEAYWPLEGDLLDASGNGRDATPWAADPIFSEGVVGTGADLGVGADTGTWNPSEATGSLTVACWIKWRSQAGAPEWQGFFGKRDDWGDGTYWCIDMNVPGGTAPTGFGFQNNGGGWTGFGENVVVDDEWTFVVATIDGDNAGATATYWNGAEVSTGTITLPPEYEAARMVFGCAQDGGNNPWTGMMDEVAIWNRALSAAEVIELYNDGEGMSMLGNQWTATLVSPPDGQKGVLTDTDVILQWADPTKEPPEPITRYDLYFSDDRSMVADINDLILPTASVAAGETLEYNAGQLVPAVYYWRIDAVISDHDPNIAYGKVWSFDTIPAAPDVASQPAGVMAAVGSTVQYEFVAASLHPITYEWKKEGDAAFSREGSVLTLENVTAADEGFYYCEATNIGGTTTSASAGFELPKLLAHYKLDDVVASTDELAAIADSGPFEHDGIENGEVQSVGGFIDGAGALLFDGDGDYIDTGTWNPNVTSPELTVSVWTKWAGTKLNSAGDANIFQAMIGKRDDWGSNLMMWQFGMGNGPGELSFQRDGAWVGMGGQILPVGEWAHVAVTFDGTTARTYFNGREVGSGAFSFGTGTDSLLLIGNAGINQDRFNGALDDLQIYNYALSRDAVSQMYLDGSKLDSVCQEYNQYDYNQNCYVDLPDLAIFLDAWMDCNIVPDCIP